MIIRIVKLTIQPDKLDEFLSIYESSMKKIRHFENCHHLELLESSEENILFTYSHWSSAEALENYRDSLLFKTTWSKVKPLFGGKPEAWSLTQKFKI